MNQQPDAREIDRLPPQAVEMEQAVLGAMICFEDALNVGIELIPGPGVFYQAPHAKIFSAISRMFNQGTPVDQLTLPEELGRRAQLEEVGNVVYIGQLASQVASGANIRQHIAVVVEKFRRRRLIEQSRKMEEEAYDEGMEIGQIVERADQGLLSVADASGSQEGFVLVELALSEAVEEMERARGQDGLAGLSTGLADLDHWLGGLIASDLIVLAARPSQGKTALGLQLAQHAAMAGTPAAVFSLEMSRISVAQRLMAQGSGVAMNDIRLARLRDEDWQVLTRSIGSIARAPLFINESGDLSVTAARAQIRRLHQQHGIGLVVVDYIQLMSGEGDSREQEVAQIARGLKAMTKELKIPVVAIAQLNRAVESRPKMKPQLSDLRESGEIEAAADTVLFIYHPHKVGLKGKDGESLEGKAELIIGKQRNGPTGSFMVQWDERCTRFADLAPEYRMASPGVR